MIDSRNRNYPWRTYLYLLLIIVFRWKPLFGYCYHCKVILAPLSNRELETFPCPACGNIVTHDREILNKALSK